MEGACNYQEQDGERENKGWSSMDVASTYEMKPLSNFDIEKIVKEIKINHFRGVFSKDMLPTHMKANESVIINLQD